MDTLALWTTLSDTAYAIFSGIGAYEGTFEVATVANDVAYLLKLDNLYESARVYVNGADAGIAWRVPFRLEVGPLLNTVENTIRIETANLIVIRIRGKERRQKEGRPYNKTK